MSKIELTSGAELGRWCYENPNLAARTIENLRSLCEAPAAPSADNAGQGNRPAHVLCVGLTTLRRLFDGEAIWTEAAQAGAIAADDLLESKREIEGLLLQLDERVRKLRGELHNCDANIIIIGECAKLLRRLVKIT